MTNFICAFHLALSLIIFQRASLGESLPRKVPIGEAGCTMLKVAGECRIHAVSHPASRFIPSISSGGVVY
jgi:sulfopyruvate decarboxylase TPP-binding subunit